jgi:hypothetical protein
MKRPLQFVGFVIAALLAVQPALAGGLCFTAPDAQQMTSSDCCASPGAAAAHHGSVAMHRNSQAIVSEIPDAQMQSECDEGCCSVAPQQTPQPSAPEKATAIRAPIVAGCIQAIATPDKTAQSFQSSYPRVSARARHLLLNVFRI